MTGASAGVSYPRGFVAAGTTAGFKPSGHPDLGLLVGEAGTTAAGLFTTNLAAAAPVRVSRERLAAGPVRAVLVNSGQANAATGERGLVDARSTTAEAAALLGLAADEVLPCSTGVIGEPVHVDHLTAALPTLTAALSPSGGPDFALAVMTTDTVPKTAELDAGGVRVGGCAKGVGMIAPHLATMLVFVTTDAVVRAPDLHALARAELGARFDALTVDACPSTNDTVLLFASGTAGGPPVTPGTTGWAELSEAVGAVGQSLLEQLAADAEGAGHVLIVDVGGAGSDHDARVLARAVAESPLVKTAAFGGDPNPGRIVQALGAAGVVVDPGLVDVAIGGVPLVRGGVISPGYFAGDGTRDLAKKAMREPEIGIDISVGRGPGRSRVYGVDLSYEYVRINGEYTT